MELFSHKFNTMVGGGVEMVAGEKIKNDKLGEKNGKGERKREENYIKNGEKVLKMHLFES